ncbi:MAG: aminotransferase class V-fold PLP-dependent enzyme [Cellulomonadaceae bacterium]|jgi:selenocysteine lyase/cysteine desulfurase|nr:aminotransferase class V-fold PLP-dependent enzyme [Cellulomonadaceae bacterium]
MIFSKRKPTPGSVKAPGSGSAGGPSSGAPGSVGAAARYGFDYLPADEVYLDSACQTLRPAPVQNALLDYYQNYGACGERAKYDWGLKVDEKVAAVRKKVLHWLELPAAQYAVSFTLNTTYGLNLLLTQLPRYNKIITTHTEHNSVFLSTMSYAKRVGVPRLLLDRDANGNVLYSPAQLAGSVVVISAMDNVTGAAVANLRELVHDTHKAGGIIIIDAAQAAGHAPELVTNLPADAICFSAHKMYGASLGVIVARNALIESLELSFLGGGQVSAVSADSYTLLNEPYALLEPGLQAWGEIIALGAALDWMAGYQANVGESISAREHRLGTALYDGIAAIGKYNIISPRGSSIISVVPKGGDGHRIAVFLSKAGIRVRSGFFCAHHWLQEQLKSPPLVRFSVGAHNTDADIAKAIDYMGRLAKTF